MEASADFVPTKEHDCNEGGLHKEGDNALNSKRCAKYITDKPRIITPVRTKLKFKYQPCGHTNGKIDTKEFHPKLSRAFPELVFLDIVEGFHDAHNQGKTQRKWHKQPMITGGKCKLRPGPVDGAGI